MAGISLNFVWTAKSYVHNSGKEIGVMDVKA